MLPRSCSLDTDFLCLGQVMKRTAESEALYRKALEHCSKTHGQWYEQQFVAALREILIQIILLFHRDALTATLHNNLGLLLKTLERFDGAMNHYREALDIRRYYILCIYRH